MQRLQIVSLHCIGFDFLNDVISDSADEWYF